MVSKVTEMTAVRLTAWVEGRVQGVGFRWWVRSRALELGLVGFAENLADGRVKVVAEGAAARCEDLLSLLTDRSDSGDPAPDLARQYRYRRPGRVTRVAHRWAGAAGDMSGFTER